ncbi:MAG: AIR carboxylase family protein, partial [Myxococcota bacterium]
GVPIEATSLKGLDALLSIVQMPGGVPVATFAVGKPGAINAALYAAQILAPSYPALAERLQRRREGRRDGVLENRNLESFDGDLS